MSLLRDIFIMTKLYMISAKTKVQIILYIRAVLLAHVLFAAEMVAIFAKSINSRFYLSVTWFQNMKTDFLVKRPMALSDCLL